MEEERLYDVYALDEDIKRLEKFINEYNTDEDLFCFVNYNTIQAIEHLIEAYKKVKDSCIELATTVECLHTDLKEKEEEELHWKGQYHLLSRKIAVIPKSKIKEKIEEYKQEADEEIYPEGYSIVDAFQELLEEE